MKSESHNMRCSDHALIINDIETQYTTKLALVAIPSKINELTLCQEASRGCQNFNTFYNKFMKLKESSKLFTLHRQKLHPVKQEYIIPDDNIFDVQNNKLFTKASGYAHKLLNKLTILHSDKKEGGITNCIKLSNNEFITTPKEIIYFCLNVPSSIQIDTKYNLSIPTSSLSPIDIEIAKELQTKMSRNKGVTGDRFSGTWFAKTKLTHSITDLWTSEIFKLFPKLGKPRLIPLNKVWPNIPTPEQFRPIIIISPLYKWLETQFIDKLNDYQVYEMKREQIGFVPNMSTLTNIRKMILDIQSYKKNDRKHLYLLILNPHSILSKDHSYMKFEREKIYQKLMKLNFSNVCVLVYAINQKIKFSIIWVEYLKVPRYPQPYLIYALKNFEKKYNINMLIFMPMLMMLLFYSMTMISQILSTHYKISVVNTVQLQTNLKVELCTDMIKYIL